MKLFLFGGAPARDGHADVEPVLKLIEQVIRETGVRQILHIPFARIIASEPERSGDRFNQHIHIDGLEYLIASNPDDMKKIKSPVIFISGGREGLNLLEKINTNPILLQLIKNADYIIGESKGSMVLGEYMETKLPTGETKILKGLALIPDTIILPHYIERNRQGVLDDKIRETNVHYGIGIDSGTGIECDAATFPAYTKIGDGVVEIKTNPER